MRIAHVMETMEVGGAEVLVASLCRLQRQTGHTPLVYCLYRLGVLGEKLVAEGFPVRVIRATSRLDKARAAYRLFHEDRMVSEVNPALCQGCGTCIAACPSQAITGTGFSNEQILAQLEGLLMLNVDGSPVRLLEPLAV